MNRSFRRGLAFRILSFLLVAALAVQGPLEGLALAHAASASRMVRKLRAAAPPATAAPVAGAGRVAAPGGKGPSQGAEVPPPFTWVAPLGGPLADMLPVPVQPRSVAWITAPTEGGADPWTLFDGRGEPAFGARSSDPVRLAMSLESPTRLAALTVLGPTEGTLTVWADDGGPRRLIESLDHVAVRARPGEWKRLPVQDVEPASRLVAEWVPSSPTGPAGIGLWGLSAPVREATDPELADRILSGALPGTLVSKASPDEAEISRIGFGPGASAAPREGRFEVRIGSEPRTWAHAFLVYELTGLGHFTQAVRQINGATPRGGASVAVASEGGLQVEEIAPEWLRRGTNEVRFLPLAQAGAPGYAVRQLRIVGTGHAGLVEARMADASRNGRRMHRDLAFETLSQPHDLVFELLERTEARLSLRAAGAPKTAGPMQIDLQGLEPGWHHVDLDRLPPSASVDVALEPKSGASGFAPPIEGVTPAVSEVVLTASALPYDPQRIAVAYPLHGECRDHHAWVTGFVGGSDQRIVSLRANGVPVDVEADGSFAADVPEAKGSGNWSALLEATMASGKVLRRALPLSPCEDTPATANADTSEDDGAPLTALVRAGEKKTISFAGATLDIPAGAVDHDVRITVRPLVPGQVAQMSPGLMNVSPARRAYRFGPHGLKFKKPVKLTLPYEPAALTHGVTERDIFGFYYDESLTRWERVGRYGVAAGGTLTSLTEHFTDFISGVLAMPDEPGVKSFNKNEMSGMKLADPGAGLGLVSTPAASSSGAATLSYPLELPPGRNGVQPNLALTYNSQRSNGWVGEGWDIGGLSAIEIDTRFGVPRYDETGKYATDRYLLDGEELMSDDGQVAPVRFARRVEGRFETIQRNLATGIDPTAAGRTCVTGWTVTDKRGTVFTYGGSGAVLQDSANPCRAARWGLSSVTDPFGNQMTVTYFTDGGMSQGFTAFYPSEIDYTAHPATGLAPAYAVQFFLRQNASRTDVVTSGRPGFLERTQFLLDHVDVMFKSGPSAGAIIRRYQLAYHQDDVELRFMKSLLASVTQMGVGAAKVLDQHTFDYGKMQGTSDNHITGFGPTMQWGSGASTNDGLSQITSNLSGGGGGGGIAVPFVSASINSSSSRGDETGNRLFVDVNGDGMPDLLGSNGPSFVNLLHPELFPLKVPNPGHVRPSTIVVPNALLHNALMHTNKSAGSTGGGVDSEFGGGGASYSSTSVEDDQIAVDVDGDGLLDEAWIDSGVFTWSKNCGDIGHTFASSQTDPNTFLYTPPLCPQGSVGQQGTTHPIVPNTLATDAPPSNPPTNGIVRINPLLRWTPPFYIGDGADGDPSDIRISGPVQKRHAGGNGVDVFIYENDRLIWGVTLGQNDLDPCFPVIRGNPGSMARADECGGPGGFVFHNIAQESEFFFMTRPHQDPLATSQQTALESLSNDVSWDPLIQYLDSSGNSSVPVDLNGTPQPDAREPYGAPIFTFDQASDFSVAGPAHVDWVATLDGTVHVSATPTSDSFMKGETSDVGTAYIIGTRGSTSAIASACIGNAQALPVAGALNGTITSQLVPAASVPVELAADICVHVGDKLQFQLATNSPIDVSRVPWQPTVTYRNICRPSSTVNGDFSCARVSCPNGTCTLTGGDPDSDVPPSFNVVQQQAQPFYAVVTPATVPIVVGPLLNIVGSTEYRHYTPRSHPPQQGPTPGQIQGGSGATRVQKIQATQAHVSLAGRIAVLDPDGPVYVAVQGINHFYASIIVPSVGPPPGGGTPSSGLAVFDTFIDVQKDDVIMVNVYASPDVTVLTNIPDPNLTGGTAPPGISANGGTIPVNVLVADVSSSPFQPASMSGGMHDWFTGFYDGDANNGVFVSANVDPRPLQSSNTNFFAFGTPQPFVTPPRWTGPGGTYIAPGLFVAGRGPIRSNVNVLRHASTWNVDNSISVGSASFGKNKGQTTTDHDFFDLNGDRVPDAISADGNVQFGDRTGPGQFLAAAVFPGIGNGALRVVDHATVRGSVGFGGGDNANNQMNTDTSTNGRVKGTYSDSFRVGTDYGLSTTAVDWRDINGDGLPDAVQRKAIRDANNGPNFTVQLNHGYGLGPSQPWSAQDWDNAALQTLGFVVVHGTDVVPAEIPADISGSTVGFNGIRTQDEATNNIGFNGTVSVAGGFAGGSVTAGAGWSWGVARTLVDLIDINGDGLPDQVLRVPGEKGSGGQGGVFHVHLNLGENFDPTDTLWNVPNWEDGPGLQLDGGPPGPNAGFTDPEAATDFSFIGGANDALDFRRSKTFETNFEVQICVLFVCVDGSGFEHSGTSSAEGGLEDVDGDGRPDLVFKSPGSDKIYVKLNQAPPSLNLLTSVQRPLGGSFTIAYDRAGNYVRPDLSPVVDEPINKFVMTSLAVSDGRGNTINHRFDYDPSGFYDRVEREDYNFAKVTTTRLLSDGSSAYSTDEVDYNNRDFYRKGLVSRQVTSDAQGLPFVVQSFAYLDPALAGPPVLTGIFFPAESEETTQYFEGTTSDFTKPGAQTAKTFVFDNRGNLTDMTDFGDVVSTDNAVYHITYDPCLSGTAACGASQSSAIFKPSEITAKDTAGKLLRDRRATYDPTTAAMTSYSQVIIGGVDPLLGVANTPRSPDIATWQFAYDAHGNVLLKTDPRGYQQTYTYDAFAAAYALQVQDSFGYVSSSIPDFRFGTVASETDANGNMALFTYDDFGRLSSVDGPDDIGTAEHTLALTYSEGSASPSTPAFATTAHKDVQHPGQPIMTATFADGLGRIIQTKKSLARDVGGGVTTGMAVSGAVVFDAFGRLSLQGQPFFDLNSPTTFVPSTLSNTVTHDLYDVMDRVVSTALLDTGKREAVTISTTSYGFDKLGSSTYRATTIKDANVNEPSIMSGPALPGFAREELRDVRGNVIEVKQTNRLSGPLGAATPLTTFYGYDGLQQLLSVTDAKGNVTRAVYDTAGRMVTLISPDMGRTDFEHDLSGNLAKKQTAKLAAKVQFVKYQYDFNRLREVDYPTSPAVKYTYGAPAEAGPVGLNRAGRVKQETSEAGTKTYEYDALGNMNLETFSLLKVGAAGTQTTDFVTETLGYDYDSFGRLLRIFYPGPAAEVVSYGYDGGGNLDTVSGVTQNGATTPYLTHIGYDEFGQKELLVSGNGIKTTYGYDPNTRRLTQISASELDPALVKAKAAARPFQEMVYSYDPVGNITQILNNAPFDPRLTTQVRVGPVVENFTYDDLYQLATVDGIAQTASTSRAHFGLTMNYDAISNAVHKAQSNAVDTLSSSGTVTNTAVQSSGTYTSAYTYAGPRPHAPTEVDDTVPAAVSSTPVKGAFTYDPSGNESGWTRKSSSATTARQLVFDEENRLTQITRNGEELQASLYDGSGQRAVKRANDSTQTAYFGPNLTVRDGAVLTKHIFAGDMRIATKLVPDAADEQCATCNDRPSVLYFHSDQLGSTSFVSDATQALVAHEEYYPSGELWVDQTNPAPGMPQPYLFNGKELDTETGLYYYGARYYDPRVQIWISPDPILAEYMQGRPNGGVFLPRNLGLYTYAWNNSVRVNDPDGREPYLVGTPCYAERCEPVFFIPLPSGAEIEAAAGWVGASFARAAAWLGWGARARAAAAAAGAAAAGSPAGQQAVDTAERTLPAVETAAAEAAPQLSNVAAEGAGGAAQAVEKAAEANKLIHIFGKAGHNLGGLVQKFGSQQGAFRAIQSATQAAVQQQGLTGVFETAVEVGGAQVTVRGAVIEGIVNIGTAFVPIP